MTQSTNEDKIAGYRDKETVGDSVDLAEPIIAQIEGFDLKDVVHPIWLRWYLLNGTNAC